VVGALTIILGYWFINGMLSTVIAPRFFGQGLNLSPVVALVAVLFWGTLLGPVGSIVGVPMTAMIKSIVLDNYEGTRWLAGAVSAGDGTTTSEGNQPS
jgi:predicted PurR-regulated permease PerM